MWPRHLDATIRGLFPLDDSSLVPIPVPGRRFVRPRAAPVALSRLLRYHDDSARVIFSAYWAEPGKDPRTLAYERQPGLADVSVSVDGPLSTFPTGATPRYTVRITNRGSMPVDDLVLLRTDEVGVVGGLETENCLELCGLSPLAPGQTASYTFDVIPQRVSDNPSPRVQFMVRAQSAGDFDRTPADNFLVVAASEASAPPNGGGDGGDGGGGGGGSFGGSMFLLLALTSIQRIGAARRNAKSSSSPLAGPAPGEIHAGCS